MNKQNILFTIIGLLLGFILGFFLANNINRNSLLQPTVTLQNPQLSPAGNPQMQSAADIKESTDGAMMPEVAQIMEKARSEPNNFQAQIRAGEIFLRIQNTEKALEYFNKAAAVRHDSFEDLSTLGNAFFDARNFEEAEKWYTAALGKKPDDVNVRTDLGSTFMERPQPDLERAIREYRTSLEKNPKHESTIFNLSVALYKKGDQSGAREMLAQLKQINPQSPLVSRLEQRISGTTPPAN